MGNAYESASSQVNEINAQYANVNTSVKSTTESFSSQVLSVNNLALSGATLFMAFERIENSQVMLDRANLLVQKSTNSLTSAQETYNEDLAQYGPYAQQTIDAAAKLSTAQDSLTVANERVDMAQRNLTNSMIYASLTVIPSLMAIGSKVYSMYENWKTSAAEAAAEQDTLSASATTSSGSMSGLAVGIGGVVAGIALLVLSYQYANTKQAEYEAAGFRTNAVNDTATMGFNILGGSIARYAADTLMATLGIDNSMPTMDELVSKFTAANLTVSEAADLMVKLNYSEASITTVTDAMTAAYGTASTATADLASGTSGLTASLLAVQTTMATQITAENTLYTTEQTELKASWDAKLGVTKTALETIQSEINTYYTAQETAATTANAAEVTAANAAYAQQLTDFSSYWTTKLGLQTNELTKVEGGINSYYDAQIATANTAYAQELTDFTSYWSQMLGLQTTELTTVTTEINSYYDKQITAVQTATQLQTDALNAGYAQELTDFTSFWNTKLGISNTELDQVDQAITTHYNQQISDTQTAYNQQISDANAFYDDLVASTMTGLNNIRAARQADLDDLELKMLLQKTALEDAHDKGLINDKDYQTQLNTINSTYNGKRSDVSDHYRLQELEAEKTQTDDVMPIEAARTFKLKAIKEGEAQIIGTLENRKNADLLDAQTQYTKITTTDQATLTFKLKVIKEGEAQIIGTLENRKNADLLDAQTQYTKITTTDAQALADKIIGIETQRNTDLTNAAATYATITTTGLQTLNATLAGLAQTLADAITSSENQKNADLATAYTENETAAKAHMANLALITATPSTATPSTATPSLPSISTATNPSSDWVPITDPTVKQAAIAAALKQLALLSSQLYSGEISQAFYNAAYPACRNELNAANAMQYGGIVTQPTLALIGEAGPEAVIPLGRGGDYGSVTYDFSGFSVIINVEGSVDQRTLAVLREELRNVVVEATSSSAPATQRKIKLGSSRF
jgi:hypothetical protein